MLSEFEMIELAQKYSPLPLDHAEEVLLVWFNFERDWCARFRPRNKVILSKIEISVNDESLVEDARLRAVPSLAHELCHYEQYRKLGILWWLFCIPIIRKFTLEREAYWVEDVVRERIFGELG